MAILATERDRQLFSDIYLAVSKACSSLIDHASFDDRDGAIADAAFRKIQGRIASGEVQWEDREVHIARYVAKSISLERLGMARRAARHIQATEDYDPCDTVADARMNVHESVEMREELRERIAEARRKAAQRLRKTAIFKHQVQLLAQRKPEKEQVRFVTVMLCLHKGDKIYADVAVEVASMGYGMPDLVLMRQWTKRYGTVYQTWFDAEVSTLDHG